MTDGETTTIEALMLLATAYPHAPELSDETTQLYVRMLADIPPPVLEVAVAQHVASSKFFPTVAELREQAVALASEAGSAPSAAEAWGEVVRAVGSVGYYGKPEFSHPRVSRAVECVGWQAICLSETPGVERAHFLRVYEQLDERAKSDARLLPASRELRQLVAAAAGKHELGAGVVFKSGLLGEGEGHESKV